MVGSAFGVPSLLPWGARPDELARPFLAGTGRVASVGSGQFAWGEAMTGIVVSGAVLFGVAVVALFLAMRS